MPLKVAIVGSGPAGFYTADALLKQTAKKGIDVEIDMIERLATPYGLIRDGVAPDHQTTKNVSKAYEKTAKSDEVRYYGNVEIGRDISLDELRQIYDAVVLSVGAPTDKPIGVPGEDKSGVYGSASFVGWYNGHPDFRDLNPDLDTKAVAIIGVGNVALDIARVLVKTRAEMATSDLVDYAAAAIDASPLTDVYMFGRRGPVEAKFTNVELREMTELENAIPVVDPGQIPDEVTGDWSDRDRRLREKNLDTFRDFLEVKRANRQNRAHFVFNAKPVEILGGDAVEGLRLEKTKVEDGRAVGTGEFFEIECGIVIAAIGYGALAVEGAPFDEKEGVIPNEDGRVEKGLYVAGWIKRGPTGVIGTNKPDGKSAAERIIADCGAGAEMGGRRALEGLLKERSKRWVTFGDWLKIDKAEVAGAKKPAPRRKLTTREEQFQVLN